MFDDLDAMQAALNDAERAARKKRRKSPAPARFEITYWSQTEKSSRSGPLLALSSHLTRANSGDSRSTVGPSTRFASSLRCATRPTLHVNRANQPKGRPQALWLRRGSVPLMPLLRGRLAARCPQTCRALHPPWCLVDG